jgi:Ca2+/Na+ antiporter
MRAMASRAKPSESPHLKRNMSRSGRSSTSHVVMVIVMVMVMGILANGTVWPLICLVVSAYVVFIFSTTRYEAWLEEHAETILQERFHFALNSEYHSPLTLAAVVKGHGDDTKNMLQYLLGQMKKTRFQLGPVTNLTYSLEGLELPFAAWRYENGDEVGPQLFLGLLRERKLAAECSWFFECFCLC